MLKQRLLTAVVLIPLVVISLLYLPTSIFKWLLAGVVGLAAWEWFAMIGFNSRSRMLFAVVTLIFTAVIGLFLWIGVLLIIAIIVWTLVLLFVGRYAHHTLPKTAQRWLLQPVFSLIMATVALSLFWLSAIHLHATNLGPQQLLYVLVLVWLADTGGYFAGKRWGRRPLAKAISPNKTWEGVAGALVLGFIWAMIAYYWGLSGTLSLSSWLILSAISLLVSIVGDLFESLFKRSYQVKDSGHLLPGHGGMLDRIDSLIAAVPVFTAGLFYLGTL
ncbi:MAG: phosphatidate cytidylyltransferase [Methylophaga sp.]|nr:MAG: phosphatidate cytidylyltransferase [Methylophaga sp.]